MSESHYVIRIPKRWFQLRLGPLLALMLIVGAILGVVGKRLRDQPPPMVFQKTYYVADLVQSSAGKSSVAMANFGPLITSITTQVAPTTWTANGGTGALESFPTNLSLVISQTDDVHKDIAKYLKEKRHALDNAVPLTELFVQTQD